MGAGRRLETLLLREIESITITGIDWHPGAAPSVPPENLKRIFGGISFIFLGFR